MLKQKINQIKQGKLTAEQNIKQFLEKIKSQNPSINAVLHINPNALEQAKQIDKKTKKGKLAGLGVIIKSNICVKDLITNCASKTLENYKAPYNATVINKLLNEDAIILGMANMDEFACGSTGENSAFNICKNPKALERVPGGSSSGSAASVAADFCDFSLGSDTGGSIRAPASFVGIVGLKPTYGTVSRYGLIDLSMSLDQIGPLTKKVEDAELIYNIIKGKDEKDATSMEYKSEKKDLKKIKIGIFGIKAEDEIWDLIRKKVKDVCDKEKWSFNNLEINYIDLGIQTYYPINYTEFFSGTRKFDGRKYGFKIEETCGEEVLRRILGGQEISKAEYKGKYYRKALAVRNLIKQEFDKAFKKYDILVSPTMPKLPHKIGDKITQEDVYFYDACTVLANLCEIPAISIPAGQINNIPIGIQLLAKKGNDNLLLEIGKKFEDYK